MLAKIANDNAGNQVVRGVLQVFASKLAPTEKPGNKKPDFIIGLEVARQAGKVFTLPPA
ncbi:hypothetical protein [Pseudomonas paralactis]|uniref:hypothetical protein n=1 Tax=Pseudomonas paralactis TaxID=1615673 RepID=UPI0034D7B0A3